MGRATIREDLTARILRYRTRYKGARPKELPVTLDEWAWISEELYGADGIDAAKFDGVTLALVDSIFETPDGGLVVRR